MERLTLKALQSSQHLLEGFCRNCKLRGMTEESIRRYKSSLKIFTQFLNRKGLNVNDVDVHALRDFLQHIIYQRKNKHKTIGNYFSALSAFYDYLTFERVTNTNIILPFRKRYLRRYKNGFDDPERKLLSVEEIGKLVNSILDPPRQSYSCTAGQNWNKERRTFEARCG